MICSPPPCLRYLSYRTHFDKQLTNWTQKTRKRSAHSSPLDSKRSHGGYWKFLEQGQEKEGQTKKQNTRAICRVCTGCVMRCRFHSAGTVFSPATTAAPHNTCVATIPALPSFSSSIGRHSYYSSSLSLSLSLSLSSLHSQCTRACRCARGISLSLSLSLSGQRWNCFLGFGEKAPFFTILGFKQHSNLGFCSLFGF